MNDNERNSPATKADLQDLAQELRAELRSEFQQIAQHLRDELKEAIRDSQAEILKGIYGYLQTTQTELKETESREDFLRQRVNILEGRMLEVERRLNMPPHP